MNNLIHRAWADYIQPILQRPNRLQVAALCHRRSDDGGVEVLIATSLSSRRWILPKGWPMDDMDLAGTARAEAWEEAGVVARPGDPLELGNYLYEKRLAGGQTVTCEVRVFAFEVDRIETEFPESGERVIRWVAPDEAAELVDETGLAEILRRFARQTVSGA